MAKIHVPNGLNEEMLTDARHEMVTLSDDGTFAANGGDTATRNCQLEAILAISKLELDISPSKISYDD